VGEAGQSKHSGDLLFPLEPIGILIDGKKLSSEPGPQLRFHAHRQLAKALFLRKKILSERGFGEVGWEKVHSTLHSVSRLFQLWASKHVLGIAVTMKFLSHQDGRDRSCPSCLVSEETCRHVAVCPDAGRTVAFEQSMACVTSWMSENVTHPDIKAVVSTYALGRGQASCITCADGYPAPIKAFAASQDEIGWDNFMMGMVSHKLFSLQESHLWLCAPHRSPDRWATGFVTQLLQVTHGQWIYRCLTVHDHTSGTLVNLHKSELLEEISNQLLMGAETLMEDDKYLLECNLLTLATSNGKEQEYWLLAIKAARMACLIRQQQAHQQCIIGTT
jgi:hypothetical protein